MAAFLRQIIVYSFGDIVVFFGGDRASRDLRGLAGAGKSKRESDGCVTAAGQNLWPLQEKEDGCTTADVPADASMHAARLYSVCWHQQGCKWSGICDLHEAEIHHISVVFRQLWIQRAHYNKNIWTSLRGIGTEMRCRFTFWRHNCGFRSRRGHSRWTSASAFRKHMPRVVAQ